MPTIDASIYNALLQPRKSAMDYADEYAAADDRQMARQFNALKMQEAQQGLQDQAGYRNALKAASGTDEERINALIRSGNPLAIKHGQEMLKALLDAQKVQTDIGRTKAETGKLQGEAVDAALKRYRGALDFIDTPEGAKRWLQAQYSDPATAAYMQQLGPFEQAVTRIPTDPQGFQNWRGQAAMGMEKHMQQLLAQKEYDLKANNELIGPDGKVNTTLHGLKLGIAKAGASNISVNTEKSYAGHIAEGLAKNDVAALDAARTAPDRVNTARAIKQVLDSNKAITGTGAEARLAITKALSTAGLIDGGSTTATEDLVSLLNSQTLDAVKSSGLGSGQGFTDKDLQFLQDAKSGRIEINAQTLRRMADLNERAGLALIAYGNKIAARLKGNPTMGTVGQDLEVKPPEDGMAAAIAAEAARRAKLNGGR